eukprot:451896-Ditylum_brightwellii.AAC.1
MSAVEAKEEMAEQEMRNNDEGAGNDNDELSTSSYDTALAAGVLPEDVTEVESKPEPESQGYMWFVLADSKTSYILNLTPDGCLAGQKGCGSDKRIETRGEHGKIWSSVILFLNAIIDVVEKTKKKFVVAMNTYFTLSKVCAMMCEYGIGTVETARFFSDCPPASIRKININGTIFNELFGSINEFGTLAVRWMVNRM